MKVIVLHCNNYRTRVITTRGYYSFWGFLVAILFSKIKEVTKGAGTIQERVLITPVRYFMQNSLHQPCSSSSQKIHDYFLSNTNVISFL